MKPRRTVARGSGWLLLVREPASATERDARGVCRSSADVYSLIGERINREAVEVMYLIALNSRNGVVGLVEVSRGGVSGCSVTARDILRAGLVVPGCSGFILVHNHPSGDPTPSSDDISTTRIVRDASEIVGLPLVDHVIVAGERFKSLRDLGILP